MTPDDSSVMNIRETAKWLGKPLSTVRKWINDNEILQEAFIQLGKTAYTTKRDWNRAWDRLRAQILQPKTNPKFDSITRRVKRRKVA